MLTYYVTKIRIYFLPYVIVFLWISLLRIDQIIKNLKKKSLICMIYQFDLNSMLRIGVVCYGAFWDKFLKS